MSAQEGLCDTAEMLPVCAPSLLSRWPCLGQSFLDRQLNMATQRRWIEQEYPGHKDEKAHFDWAVTAFRDRRHMTLTQTDLLRIVTASHAFDRFLH